MLHIGVSFFPPSENQLNMCQHTTVYIQSLSPGSFPMTSKHSQVSSAIFFFFFFLATPWHTEFQGQGSDPSCSFHLCYSCGNAGSLTTVRGWGSNLHPGAAEMPPILLHHSGNSSSAIFFFFSIIFVFTIIVGLQCSVNFLLHSKVTQSHIHIYILFLILSFIMLHHK